MITCCFVREFAATFDALFRLDEIYGLLKLSPAYLNKVKQWLHNDETLLEQIRKQVYLVFYQEWKRPFELYPLLQLIIKVYNRYTHEEMLFNYMRSQRPQMKSDISPEN